MRSEKARGLATRFTAATVVLFLLFGPYLANLMVDHSRAVYMWSVRDSLTLVGMIGLAAALCVLVRALVGMLHRPLLTRLFDHGFVLALGGGVLANLWFQTQRPVGYRIGQFGMETGTAWIALAALVGFSLARPASRLVACCRQLCLVLSPAVIIITVQLLRAPTYPRAMDDWPGAESVHPPAGARDAPKNPVYLFVFDEWSYERTYDHGEVREDLPNLRALSARAVTFHDAHSPAGDTERAVSRLLFENDWPVVCDRGRVGFERDGAFVASSDVTSVFDRYGRHGYDTVVVGFSLPWGQWVGGHVDTCRSYPWFHVRPGVAEAARVHAVRAMKYWTDPWSSFVYGKVWPALHYEQIARRHVDMKRDVLEIIEHQAANTFAVIHYPLPHNPYLFDEDGTFCGPDRIIYSYGDVEGYERNLAALDRLIGELVGAMTRAERYDDALIILTSDHTFRYDPLRESGDITCPPTHVPLIVKPPGECRTLAVAPRFENRRLGRLIDQVLATGGNCDALEKALTLLLDGVPPLSTERVPLLSSSASRAQRLETTAREQWHGGR